MIWIVATTAWGFVAALVAALVALALDRWFARWTLARRVLVAVAAATSPSFGMVSFWFSPDEFLISFGLHIFVIVAISTPIAWLISRRTPPKLVPMDVFD